MTRVGLFLGIGPNAGGMFQYALSVLEALAALDKNSFTVIVAYGADDWESLLPQFGLLNVRLRYFKRGQFIANAAMALRIPASICRKSAAWCNPMAREMTELQCDCWIFPGQDAMTFQIPVRAIGTIHDLMHRYQPHFPEVSSSFRYGIREHRFSNIARCAAVLVDSNVGREQVVESYGVAPDTIYPLPYVAPSYILDRSLPDDAIQRYGLPTKFLFYPAQFWAHKNHLRLLEAVSRLVDKCNDIALVCSGGKRHAFQMVEDKANALGIRDRVHFIGYVPNNELRSIYLHARALVMPTFFGPTNIPPLEAMVVGCPVLISRLYGMPEQSGDAALYFDPESVEEMASCIHQIWSNDTLAEELSQKGLKRSLEQTQAAFNQRLRQILEGVLNAEVVA